MKTEFIPKVMDGSAETYEVDYQIGSTATNMHWHSCIEIIYVIKTMTQIFFGNQWNELHEGDMILIPPGRIHYCRCADENAIRVVIGIGERVICPETEQNDKFLIPFETDRIDGDCIFRNVSANGIGEKIELLCEYERLKPPAHELLSHALLMEIYAYAYSEWSSAGLLNGSENYSKVVRNITKSLAEDIVNPPSAYKMSEKLEISYSYMCRLLKDSLGCSYGELLNRMRVDAAKKMLLTTESSVTDIGYDCGFCDSSYFIKIFHRYTGVTPRKYRENGLK